MTEATGSMRSGLNKDKTTFFFTSAKQMEVTKDTLIELGHKGIKKVEDLAELETGCREPEAPGRSDEESRQGTQQ
eukprot:2196081-Ditylum_brightwellii.AAC.1